MAPFSWPSVFLSRSSNSGSARKTVAKYPTGTQVQVYYNPENPDESVLELGAFWSTHMVYGIGLLFFEIGLLVTGSLVWKLVIGTAAAIGGTLVSGQANQMQGFSSRPPDSPNPPSSSDDDGFRIG